MSAQVFGELSTVSSLPGLTALVNTRVLPTLRTRGFCNGHPAFPTPSRGRKIHARLGRLASRGADVCLGAWRRRNHNRHARTLIRASIHLRKKLFRTPSAQSTPRWHRRARFAPDEAEPVIGRAFARPVGFAERIMRPRLGPRPSRRIAYAMLLGGV